MPSHMRSSTVPKSGCGRQSHQISRIDVMTPAVSRPSIKDSNSCQSARRGGSPAVGRPSKTFVRLEAMPVSVPNQNGLDADAARNSGRWNASDCTTATDSAPPGTPTWKCTPWIASRRAGHWMVSIRCA